MKEKNKKTKKNIIYNVLMLIALAVFLFSAYKLGVIFYQNYMENKGTEKIQEIAKVPANPEKEAFSIDWKKLQETNPEIMGWILLPDTDISYPIVQGKDNDYYLTHTFEKKENYAGAIFLDMDAKADFSLQNTFIYGHNVKHGTMFAQLENFKEQAFFDKHQYLYIFTPTINYRSEVLGFYSTTSDSQAYMSSFSNADAFNQYIQKAQSNSMYPSIAKATSEDHLITLSTCSYERNGQPSDLRYVLHAKLVPWTGKYMVEKQ
ncbi:MAG: class B sortase [Longicatena sp.]